MDKKMKIKIKIIIAVVVILLTIACGVSAFYITSNHNEENDINNEAENNTIIENEIIQENVVDENIIQENVAKPETNTQIQTPVIENVTPVAPQGTAYESDSDVGTTNKKQEAINLVKQKWGEDNTVTFSCDSVTANGEYIIAVTSLETATVKNYFIVNLENKTVTDY